MTGKASTDNGTIGVFANSVEIATDQGIVAKNVLLLPFGEFFGRDGRGPYVLSGRQHAEAVIAATRQFAGSADILFNYDHQSEYAATPGVGGQAKAAGWIKPGTLTVAEDGIRGDVEWTEAAESALAAREYRYHSPHFKVDPRSRRITRLVNAGLTNSPNLELPALASQQPGLSAGEDEDMKTITLAATALATSLGIAEDKLTEETALAAIDQLKAAKDGSEAALASVRSELGVADDANSETVLAAVQSARSAGEPDPSKYVPIGDLKEVKDQLATINEERVLACVDTAIESGKLTPGQRDWAVKLGKQDLSELHSFLETAPVFEGGKPRVDGQPEIKKGQLTEEESAICSQLGLSPEEFLKTRDQENA